MKYDNNGLLLYDDYVMKYKELKQIIPFRDSVFLFGDGLIPIQSSLLKKRLPSGGAAIIVLPGFTHLLDLFVLRQLAYCDNGFLQIEIGFASIFNPSHVAALKKAAQR